jgi:acyl carrier protein
MENVARPAVEAAETKSPASDRAAPPEQPPAAPVPDAQLLARPDLTSPYVAPRGPLEEATAEAWSALLHIDRIGVHDNFFALGGDSLQATILLNQLQQDLGEAIPAHMLFQVQTIHDLAAHLRCHRPDAVRRRYPEEPLGGNGESIAHGATSGGAAGSLRGNGESMPAGPLLIPRLDRGDRAEQDLARLDELSDDEVQSLLEGTMAEAEEETGE